MPTDTVQQESPELREARKELQGAYESEGHYLGTRIEQVRELNGRIYFDKWTRGQKGFEVSVYRFDGMTDHDVDTAWGLRAQLDVKEEEVGYVLADGSTDWTDEQAEEDHRHER